MTIDIERYSMSRARSGVSASGVMEDDDRLIVNQVRSSAGKHRKGEEEKTDREKKCREKRERKGEEGREKGRKKGIKKVVRKDWGRGGGRGGMLPDGMISSDICLSG